MSQKLMSPPWIRGFHPTIMDGLALSIEPIIAGWEDMAKEKQIMLRIEHGVLGFSLFWDMPYFKRKSLLMIGGTFANANEICEKKQGGMPVFLPDRMRGYWQGNRLYNSLCPGLPSPSAMPNVSAKLRA